MEWKLYLSMIVVMLLPASAEGARVASTNLETDVKRLCVGRFLINVPANTTISQGYVYATKKVQTALDVSKADFTQAVATREAELSSALHDEGGSMLIKVTRFDDDAVLISSWRGDSSRIGNRQELFVFDPAHRVQFTLSNITDAAQLPAAIENYRALRQRISYRDPATIPQTAGFCIDSGFIAGDRINTEEITIGMRPRTYPGVRMTLMSYVTGKPDRPLLQRASDVPPAYAAAEMRMRKLRRGERDIGPIQGQEILAHAKEDGKQAYAFLWESQGQAESLQSPFLSFQLMTEETEGKGFSDDAQALGLWDQVLGSLRLRPGAI